MPSSVGREAMMADLNPAPGYFITGTDTGVGKTVITLGLMQLLQDRGLRVVAMKPVASGCERTAAGLRNADAMALRQQASVRLEYDRVNPYAFEPACAPHIAADRAGVRIDIGAIRTGFDALREQAEMVLVEGIGGWRVPLNDRETVADLAARLELGVILVVGIRLGCLNHALLTAAAIAASGLELAGWVANRLPPAPEFGDENISTLKSNICAPLLGITPALPTVTPPAVARSLSAEFCSPSIKLCNP